MLTQVITDFKKELYILLKILKLFLSYSVGENYPIKGTLYVL